MNQSNPRRSSTNCRRPPQDQLDTDWPAVRRALLWAGGITDPDDDDDDPPPSPWRRPRAARAYGDAGFRAGEAGGEAFDDGDHCDVVAIAPTEPAWPPEDPAAAAAAAAAEASAGGRSAVVSVGSDEAHGRLRCRIAFRLVWG